MKPERGVETYAATLFRQVGWLVYKMDQGGGVADRLMVSRKGFHLYVEFKRPGKETLDPAQVEWAKDFKRRIQKNPYVAVEGPVNSRAQSRELLEKYRGL